MQARTYMKKTGAKRHALYGDGSLSSAARMPWQFSIYNRGDPNRKKLATAHKTASWSECLRAVQAVLDGTEADPVSTATHYTELKARPAWAKDRTPVTIIGRHKFYTLTDPAK
jgi:spore germination cell wall hydrolase CwlJ-like protein